MEVRCEGVNSRAKWSQETLIFYHFAPMEDCIYQSPYPSEVPYVVAELANLDITHPEVGVPA